MKGVLLHAGVATGLSALVMTVAAVAGADTDLDTGDFGWKAAILLTWIWVAVAWSVVVVALIARAVRSSPSRRS